MFLECLCPQGGNEVRDFWRLWLRVLRRMFFNFFSWAVRRTSKQVYDAGGGFDEIVHQHPEARPGAVWLCNLLWTGQYHLQEPGRPWCFKSHCRGGALTPDSCFRTPSFLVWPSKPADCHIAYLRSCSRRMGRAATAPGQKGAIAGGWLQAGLTPSGWSIRNLLCLARNKASCVSCGGNALLSVTLLEEEQGFFPRNVPLHCSSFHSLC